jgi:hypothetical protein
MGIGSLILVDHPNEMGNIKRSDLSSLFFTPQMVGCRKIEAVQQSLTNLNPDVKIIAYEVYRAF